MKLEMMRQLPMPVQMRMAAPMRAAPTLVSATEPGMVPMKQFMRENMPPSANMAMSPWRPRRRRRGAHRVGQVAEGRGPGVSVHQHAAGLAGRHVVDPDFTGHLLRVGEEEEGAGREGHVEDVHARAAEDLLGDEHGEGRGDGDHPQRDVDRHDERDEHAADEEALVDGVPVHARDDELDAEAGAVADDDERDHLDGAHDQLVEQHGVPRIGR